MLSKFSCFLFVAAGCQRPEDLLFARVPDHVMGNKRTFPVGTVFQYECNPGYQIISGMNPSYAICASNLTWMKTGEFCEGNCTRWFRILAVAEQVTDVTLLYSNCGRMSPSCSYVSLLC